MIATGRQVVNVRLRSLPDKLINSSEGVLSSCVYVNHGLTATHRANGTAIDRDSRSSLLVLSRTFGRVDPALNHLLCPEYLDMLSVTYDIRDLAQDS